MKKDFVPFQVTVADGSRPKTESRTEVVARSQTALVFHPLSQCSAHPPAPPDAYGEPSVTLDRDGDRVTVIKVHCPCGNDFELACEYPEQPQKS